MRIFWESIPVYLRIQRLLARQRILLWRQSTSTSFALGTRTLFLPLLVGSTVDTCLRQCSRLWGISHIFFVKVELVSCGPRRGCLCLATETGMHSANCAEGWRFHSALCVQTVWWSRRAENCGVPQLQFSDKLVTCLLLRTTVAWRCRRCCSCGLTSLCSCRDVVLRQ